jgi:peptidoglycan lytic transglycosylase
VGIGLLVGLTGCTPSYLERGQASWYGPGFAGKPTASGERFVPCKRTAAHRTLPFGTRVRVTNLQNGRSVVVKINDRGPFIQGRIIDLSRGAARAIGMIDAGVVEVEIVVKRWPPGGEP